MFSRLMNMFRVPDLRNKILFTVAVIALLVGVALGWFLSGVRVQRAELARAAAEARADEIEASRSDMPRRSARVCRSSVSSAASRSCPTDHSYG